MRPHTHTHLTALFLGLPRWAGTRKVKPIWILPEQETVSDSGISWAICKSAARSRQITTQHLTTQFLQAGCPSCHPTNSVSYHATVQKLLVRQVLTISMVCSWRFSWRQCVGLYTCALNHDATESAPIVSGVINKPTTEELWISPVYRRLAVAKFSKSTM